MRIEKVNEQLKREIGFILQTEVSDPRLEFVTILNADTSRDLRHAKVYYSVLGPEQKVKGAQQSLERARGHIRKMVGQRMKMRYTPELIFIYDQSAEYNARIEETLKEIHEQVQENRSDS